MYRNKDGYISLGELKLANKEKPIRDIAEVDKKIKGIFSANIVFSEN